MFYFVILKQLCHQFNLQDFQTIQIYLIASIYFNKKGNIETKLISNSFKIALKKLTKIMKKKEVYIYFIYLWYFTSILKSRSFPCVTIIKCQYKTTLTLCKSTVFIIEPWKKLTVVKCLFMSPSSSRPGGVLTSKLQIIFMRISCEMSPAFIHLCYIPFYADSIW